MLKNLPVSGMPMVGVVTGNASACALRTAFGDVPYFYDAVTGQDGLNANYGYPDGVAETGGVLPLREFEITYLPVSRL